MSLIVNPPSLAQNHHHPHTPRDPAASEERGGRPHSHHSSSSGSIIPPITLEGRGQGRTLRAERVSGGGAPFDLYLPNPPPPLPPPVPPQLSRVNSADPVLAASSLPQSILTHPIYKTLSRQPLCYFSSQSREDESPILGLKEVWLVVILHGPCHHVISSLFPYHASSVR